MDTPLETIVSGGQTGVDRAALDTALELGVPCGGWCPTRRKAEDGRIPEHYPLTELPGGGYPERTERNVLDSDGTLILARGPLAGGTRLTADLARKHGKPVLVVDLSGDPSPTEAAAWRQEHGIRRLNVAGPRESGAPGIHGQAMRYLRQLLTPDPGVPSILGIT